MTSPSTNLALIPGSGLLCARSGELLYCPKGGHELVEVFRRSPPGALVDAVTDFAVDRELDVTDFVVIEWGPFVRLVVLGAIELTSDQPSLPRLSAADAGSWIERTLRPVGFVTVSLGSAEIDPHTNLEAGVVLAGGFQLQHDCHLTHAPGSPPIGTGEAGQSAQHHCVPTAPFPAGHQGSADEGSIVGQRPAGSPHHGPSQSPETANASEQEPKAAPQASRSSDAVADKLLSISAPPAATQRDQPEDEPPAPVLVDESPNRTPLNEHGETIIDPLQPSLRSPIPPDGVRDFQAAPDDATMTRSPAVLDAVTAMLAQKSPHDAADCILVLEPDRVEPVDRVLIIGRRPAVADDTDGTTRPVLVADPKVSGNHLRVEPVDGRVVLTDLGSTNGSFMLASGDGQPFRLEPSRAQVADPGAVIQIGSQRIWIHTADANSDLGVGP